MTQGPSTDRAIELYLIRHGLAGQRGPAYPDDAERPLTREGISRLRKEVRALVRLDIGFDQVLTSPLARARQTADIFAQGLPGRPPVTTLDALAPGGTPRGVIDGLVPYAGQRRIALVGHEPEMGELAARLLASRATIAFKKGAICRIDVETLPPAGPGTLKWLVTPRMLRTMA